MTEHMSVKALEDAAIQRVQASRDAMAMQEDDYVEPPGPPWWLVIGAVALPLMVAGLVAMAMRRMWE